jgi:hypothetical protein
LLESCKELLYFTGLFESIVDSGRRKNRWARRGRGGL